MLPVLPHDSPLIKLLGLFENGGGMEGTDGLPSELPTYDRRNKSELV